MTATAAAKDRAKLRIEGFHRRLNENRETTKYTMAGIGALVLVVINFAGTLIAARGPLPQDEAMPLVVSAWASAVCLMLGFLRLYFQARLASEVVKFEVAIADEDEDAIRKFKNFIDGKVDRLVINISRAGMLIFAGLAILSAVWAFYVVLM